MINSSTAGCELAVRLERSAGQNKQENLPPAELQYPHCQSPARHVTGSYNYCGHPL